jgi:hypothetical protein
MIFEATPSHLLGLARGSGLKKRLLARQGQLPEQLTLQRHAFNTPHPLAIAFAMPVGQTMTHFEAYPIQEGLRPARAVTRSNAIALALSDRMLSVIAVRSSRQHRGSVPAVTAPIQCSTAISAAT